MRTRARASCFDTTPWVQSRLGPHSASGFFVCVWRLVILACVALRLPVLRARAAWPTSSTSASCRWCQPSASSGCRSERLRTAACSRRVPRPVSHSRPFVSWHDFICLVAALVVTATGAAFTRRFCSVLIRACLRCQALALACLAVLAYSTVWALLDAPRPVPGHSGSELFTWCQSGRRCEAEFCFVSRVCAAFECSSAMCRAASVLVAGIADC